MNTNTGHTGTPPTVANTLCGTSPQVMKRRQNIWNLDGTPTSGLARALNYGVELTSPGNVEDIRTNADKKAQAAAKRQANALAAAQRQAKLLARGRGRGRGRGRCRGRGRGRGAKTKRDPAAECPCGDAERVSTLHCNKVGVHVWPDLHHCHQMTKVKL